MTEPVTTLELAKHLRLDDQSSPLLDEDELSRAIVSARQFLEEQTNSSIIRQERVWRRPQFPDSDHSLILPNGPVASITSIAYKDTSNADQTFTDFELTVDLLERDIIQPTYGNIWPTSLGRLGSVVYTYQAGYADGSVPSTLKSAILLFAAALFQERESQSVNGIYYDNPQFQKLVAPYRRQMGV